MKDIDTLFNIIKKALSEQDFSDQPNELFDPITYTVSQGGKRIRPLITLMTCQMFDGHIDDAIYPAIGLELFHNFTLIHDDILDKATLRRGKETVYKKWNTNIAILSGDTMFAISYRYFLKTKTENIIPILSLFNDTVIDICKGQQYDMNFETQDNVSISDYIEMIRLKTAVLLGACAKIGAVAANTSLENAEKAYAFAENLGLAFQLKDDLLDLYGDENLFGKKIGGDIESNKKTYLFLKAIGEANGQEKAELLSLFNNTEIETAQKINNVKLLYDKLNIYESTTQEIDKYYIKAIENLNAINIENSKKQILLEFANQLMHRKF